MRLHVSAGNDLFLSQNRWLEENPNAGRGGDGGLDEEEAMGIEYDADGNPIAPIKPKYIDPLPPIDHKAIDYKPFEKNFYNEHTDISSLSNIQVRIIEIGTKPICQVFQAKCYNRL